MKELFLTFVAITSMVSAQAIPAKKTVDDLIAKTRAQLPKGWTVFYREETGWFSITRDEATVTQSLLPNAAISFDGNEPATKSKFAIGFRVQKGVSADEFRRMAAENEKTGKELAAIDAELTKQRVPAKFDAYEPRNDSEKAVVARYDALKKSLHDLPDFKFHDIDLQWVYNTPGMPLMYVVDDKIRDECTRVQTAFLKLLTEYDDA